MITLDDWSELVTIDYNGGMGGEFFGLLLHDAIYKNTVYKLTAFNNKYDFKKYDVFTSYEDNNNRNQTVLKKLYYLKRKFFKNLNFFKDQAKGVDIIRNAIKMPALTIANNAGK